MALSYDEALLWLKKVGGSHSTQRAGDTDAVIVNARLSGRTRSAVADDIGTAATLAINELTKVIDP